MKRILALSLFIVGGLCTIAAQTEITRWFQGDLAYYPANLDGYGEEGFAPIDYDTVKDSELRDLPDSDIRDEGRDIGGQGVEAKAVLGQEWQIPFLQGDSPLTSGNNVKLRLFGDVSPVHIGGSVGTVWTPLALISFNGSIYAGTGWTVAGLNGLTLNTPEKTMNASNAEGMMLDADLGGTLQFDFGVLFPGDWTHVVTVYSPSLQYRHYTAADSDEAWQWQVDSGENFNGWNWKQTAVLGYLMPAVDLVDTVGILLETDRRITKRNESKMDDGGWGSDFVTTNLGPIVRLQFGSGIKLTIQGQFARARDYSEETIGNAHFSYRKVDTDSPTYWYFRRIAFSCRYEF